MPPTAPPSTEPLWRTYVNPAMSAVRIYWPAILLIQLFALGIVIAFYTVESIGPWFEQIAHWKSRGGLWASALCTIISGGIIPELVKRRFRPDTEQNPSKGEFLHQLALWGIIGMMVDLFYQFQTYLFGSDADLKILVSKVLLDQLAFTPLISMPFFVFWFLLWKHRYRFGAVLTALSLREWVDRVMPLWIMCLTFWPVYLLFVYSMPTSLQFPLFLFGNATHSILAIFIARRQAKGSN